AWAQQRSGQFVAEGTDLIRGDVPRGVREHEMRVVARMAQDPLLHLLASCRRRLLEILLEHIIGGPAHRPASRPHRPSCRAGGSAGARPSYRHGISIDDYSWPSHRLTPHQRVTA